MIEYTLILLGFVMAWLFEKLGSSAKKGYERKVQKRRQEQTRREQQRRQEEERRQREEQQRRQEEERRRRSSERRGEYTGNIDEFVTYLRNAQSTMFTTEKGLGTNLNNVLNNILGTLKTNPSIKEQILIAKEEKKIRKDPVYGKYLTIQYLIQIIFHPDKITNPKLQKLHAEILALLEQYFSSTRFNIYDLINKITEMDATNDFDKEFGD